MSFKFCLQFRHGRLVLRRNPRPETCFKQSIGNGIVTFLTWMNGSSNPFLDVDETLVGQALTSTYRNGLVVPIACIHDLVERMNIVG